MFTATAVVLVVILYAALVIVGLAVSIWVIRRGVDPLRFELARIADAIELQLEVVDDGEHSR